MKADEALKLVNKTRHIYGWFTLEAAMLFAWIDEIQKANGVVGDIFEIGVHHGKSAVLLGSMVQARREILGVCDIFSKQTANVSRSGYGDREIFERNMSLFLSDTLDIRIFAKSSSNLTAQEIGNNYRLFHIDGGHSVNESLNDLCLAADSTIDKAVIAIDDPLRPEWPGVSEAIFRFLTVNKHYCAVVVGFNKMILVRRDFAKMYSEEIEKQDRRSAYHIGYPWHLKQLPFMDYPLCIFYVPTYVSEKGFWKRIIRFYHRHNCI